MPGTVAAAVRRADIEVFARDLEERGRARATVTRRLCTIAGFYRYAVEEELLEHSPAAHVRRPCLDYESRAVGLDLNELGALLVAAGHAHVVQVSLRVSEAAKDPLPVQCRRCCQDACRSPPVRVSQSSR